MIVEERIEQGGFLSKAVGDADSRQWHVGELERKPLVAQDALDKGGEGGSVGMGFFGQVKNTLEAFVRELLATY